MKKAIMYLLLALGIILVVLFVGGAMIGFAAGFIDGFNESASGTTSPFSLMTFSGMAMVLILFVILHWVFLRLGYASYSAGRIPKRLRWKVLLGLMAAMGGLALLVCVIYNPIVPYNGTTLTEPDDAVRSAYLWMKTHPLQSILGIIAIEMTTNMIIYGAVLRELLEWKHNPIIIVNAYAAITSLFVGLCGNPMLMIPALMTAQIEGWTYEFSRSIIPIIIGDIFYWTVMLCLMGISFSSWWYFGACVVIIPAIYLVMRLMEPYKPID